MTDSSGADRSDRHAGDVGPRDEEGVGSLLADLRDQAWRVRRSAVSRLVALGQPERVVPRLLEVLAERDDTAARNAAAQALVGIGEPALPWLLGLLSGPEPDSRRFAADVLGQIASGVAVAPLIERLADHEPNVRFSAAEALGRIGGPAALRAMRGLLADDVEVTLKLCALDALRQGGCAVELSVLSAHIDDTRLRVRALSLLGLCGEPEAAGLICGGISAGPTSDRLAAVGALGMLYERLKGEARGALEVRLGRLTIDQDREVLLRMALRSSDVLVRRGALLLVRCGRGLELLREVAECGREERLLEEVIETLRCAAAQAPTAIFELACGSVGPERLVLVEALVELARPELVDLFLKMVDTGEPDLAGPAIRALIRLDACEAVGVLARRAVADDAVSAEACWALSRLGAGYPRQTADALAELVVATPSPAAVRVLGRIADERAVELVRSLLSHGDPRVRAAAMDALVLTRDDAARLREARHDRSPEVRAVAARRAGLLDRADAISIWKVALEDHQEVVVRAALEAIGEANEPSLRDRVEPLLGRASASVALAALRALGAMGCLASTAAKVAFGHADPEVLKEALGWVKSEDEGLHPALALLAHPRWDVRLAAARALRGLGVSASLEAVRSALERERDPLVRDALKEAAAACGSP